MTDLHATNQTVTAPQILLADDDPTFLLMMGRFLEKHGYQVITAADGKEAVVCHAAHTIDLALLDADMPVMDGFATCSALLQQQHDLPILIVTVSENHTCIEKTFACGATDYIHKPVHHQLLLHRIANQIRLAQEQRSQKKHESEMRVLTTALDHAGSGVIVTDARGIIQYVNQSFTTVTGYRSEEAVGNNPSMLQSGKQNRSFYQQMWKTLKKEDEWVGELHNKCKDGTLYIERLHICAIRNKRGKPTHYVGVFTDITKQLALNEEVRQSQKMASIGTLVGGFAHNFNNMLSGINGLSTTIAIACRQLPPSPICIKIIEKTNQICTIGMQSGEMIQQLLTYARKGIRSREDVELNQTLIEAWELAKLGLSKEIQANTSFAPLPMPASVDVHQIQQVLINIVNNARDALDGNQNPHITVSLKMQNASDLDDLFYLRHPNVTAGHLALLQIEDNGSGMSQQQLQQIFEPFFTTKEEGKGTGLGLSMAMGAAEDHCGALEVTSELGVGTTFLLWIPLLGSEVDDHTDTTPIDDESTPLINHGVILLMDDNAMIREMTTEILQSEGFTVIAASDGDEGVEYFHQQQQQIIAVISDVVMPHMNGTIAVAKMREIQADIPVTFITGFDKSNVTIEPQFREITQVISKPFHVQTLLNAVQTMVAHHASS